MRSIAFLFLAVATAGAWAADVGETPADSRWYAGASAGAFFPGGGSSAAAAAEVAVRLGRDLSDVFALEGELSCVPHAACDRGGATTLTGIGAYGLVHLSASETFDRLFGCERLDPFVLFGVQARFASHAVFADGSHRTCLGPAAGIGAFYHLTENLSLRADARAALGCDSPCGVSFAVSAGVQYAFGDYE